MRFEKKIERIHYLIKTDERWSKDEGRKAMVEDRKPKVEKRWSKSEGRWSKVENRNPITDNK